MVFVLLLKDYDTAIPVIVTTAGAAGVSPMTDAGILATYAGDVHPVDNAVNRLS